MDGTGSATGRDSVVAAVPPQALSSIISATRSGGDGSRPDVLVAAEARASALEAEQAKEHAVSIDNC